MPKAIAARAETSNPYWSEPVSQLLTQLTTTADGLTAAEAQSRLTRYGPNTLQEARRVTALGLFFNQFKSPLVLILIFATGVSAFVGEWTDAVITFTILFASALLSFVQEYRANAAMEALRARITLKAN